MSTEWSYVPKKVNVPSVKGVVRETREPRREALRHSNSKINFCASTAVDQIYKLSGDLMVMVTIA